ncbi:uncharacterized protein LOC144620629 isoform X2 [Crassostrea virginica]
MKRRATIKRRLELMFDWQKLKQRSFSKEPELTFWDEVKIYFNLMERPEPCPGNEELTAMALEISLYFFVLLSVRLLMEYLFGLFDKWLKGWMERNWKLCLVITFVLLYLWAATLCTKNAIKRFLFPWTKEQTHPDLD